MENRERVSIEDEERGMLAKKLGYLVGGVGLGILGGFLVSNDGGMDRIRGAGIGISVFFWYDRFIGKENIPKDCYALLGCGYMMGRSVLGAGREAMYHLDNLLG